MKWKTQGKPPTRELKSVRAEGWYRMHPAISDQHRWLCQVLPGHHVYYGIASSFRCLKTFYQQVWHIRLRALERRSQRPTRWDAFVALLQLYPLPTPWITHPCPA